jgi:hypothetical protein
MDLYIEVKSGVVVDATVYSDALDVQLVMAIQDALKNGNVKYNEMSLRKALDEKLLVPTFDKNQVVQFIDWFLLDFRRLI